MWLFWLFLSAYMQCRASISLSSSSGSDISQMMSYNSLIIEQSFHYTINSSNYWIMDFTWNLTSIPSMTSAGLVFNLIILLVLHIDAEDVNYLKIATLYQMRFKGLKSVVNCRNCLFSQCLKITEKVSLNIVLQAKQIHWKCQNLASFWNL